jgi:hypothetical protein
VLTTALSNVERRMANRKKKFARRRASASRPISENVVSRRTDVAANFNFNFSLAPLMPTSSSFHVDADPPPFLPFDTSAIATDQDLASFPLFQPAISTATYFSAETLGELPVSNPFPGALPGNAGVSWHAHQNPPAQMIPTQFSQTDESALQFQMDVGFDAVNECRWSTESPTVVFPNSSVPMAHEPFINPDPQISIQNVAPVSQSQVHLGLETVCAYQWSTDSCPILSSDSSTPRPCQPSRCTFEGKAALPGFQLGPQLQMELDSQGANRAIEDECMSWSQPLSCYEPTHQNNTLGQIPTDFDFQTPRRLAGDADSQSRNDLDMQFDFQTLDGLVESQLLSVQNDAESQALEEWLTDSDSPLFDELMGGPILEEDQVLDDVECL